MMMIRKTNYNQMSGPEKAATLLLALPSDTLKKLMEMMRDDEIQEISQIMASLGKIDSNVVEELFIDFIEKMHTSGSLLGSYESTEKLLSQVLDNDRVGGIMEEIRGPAGRTMWDKLGNINEDLLANYLKSEYPQTIAVVLSKIRSEHAAKVITLLPDNLSMEVVLRMLRMESVPKEVLNDIERTLKNEFMTNLVRSSKRDPHELVADMFNFFDRSNESKFLQLLEERNQESAERVKSLMFTFDDLQKLDNQAIQVVIKNLEKDKLAMALKGANEEIKTLFFNNMSERGAKILKDDIQALGPVRVKDVDEAQAYVVSTTKELSNRGEIKVSKGQESNEEMIG